MMIEIPEAQTLGRQFAETLTGKVVAKVVAAASPHGFAFYFDDPAGYDAELRGQTVTGAAVGGGRPELWLGNMRLSFGDGVNVRYFTPGAKLPAKHQLLVEFDDASALCCTVQMYGGMWAFADGDNDDFYYLTAFEKPSVLSPEFSPAYCAGLAAGTGKLSVKAFLATEQRIPGLGNGVLQDILWLAGVHPKRKMATLSDGDLSHLYDVTTSTLRAMTDAGGRNTEKDLFGQPGGYQVVMGRQSLDVPSPNCGGPIQRMAYLGGNVYVCEHCQPLA